MATNAEMEAIRRICWNLHNPCVVELGARTSEDEHWIRASFESDVHYVMVEPDLRNCQLILDKGVHRTRRLLIGAVSQCEGSVTFYGSETDGGATRGSGSIHAPTGHIEVFPDITFPEYLRTVVPSFSLDGIFDKEWLSKIDLLWVDIQGAERDMILGGSKALSHTRYLFMETEDRELYAGMALKSELLQMLNGWELIEDFGFNCFLKNERFTEQGAR
jgi:FkbM family methyltransferase